MHVKHQKGYGCVTLVMENKTTNISAGHLLCPGVEVCTMSNPMGRIPIRSEAEAKLHLRPHLDDLIASIRHGFAEWERIGTTERAFRAALGPRTRANVIYEHIAQEARRRFEGRQGVVLTNKHGFLTINIGSDFILRFKKLDAYGQSRNVQTKQQKLFSLQMQMFGLGDETRITAGYQLNALATEITDIKVVCPDGRRNAWGFSALEELEGEARPDSAPITPISPVGDTVLETNPEKAKPADRAAREGG
jgi:hypothetical protein